MTATWTVCTRSFERGWTPCTRCVRCDFFALGWRLTVNTHPCPNCKNWGLVTGSKQTIPLIPLSFVSRSE